MRRLTKLGLALASTLTLVLAVPSAANAGTGIPNPGNCGTAQLTVNVNTHRFLIKLVSTRGVISDGVYTIWTDGALSLSQLGFVSTQNSTTSNTLGTINVPGLNIHWAFVTGQVITSQTSCSFFAEAPWT
jgi:hypothetical protein